MNNNLRIEWNRGKSYLEINIESFLPAAAADMNRLIDTIILADCDMWEAYAEQINDYIGQQVRDLAVQRGGLDQKRRQADIAKINRTIKKYLSNSAALAKRFDVEAVKDQTVEAIPTLKKATVESLGNDNGQRVVKTFEGVTFNYRGVQFDAYQPRKGAYWEILLNGTGTGIATAAKKNQIIAALTDSIFEFLNSESGKKNVKSAREMYLKAKGMEPETEPADDTTPAAPAVVTTETEKTEKTEDQKMKENKTTMQEVQDQEVTTAATTPTAETDQIDLAALTPENIADYLPALLMSLANDKHNTSIILAAGVEAGVISPVAIVDYFHTGRMPAVHTFDVWKKAGYTVRKGEHAAFQARIWKYTEKKAGTYTEEEAASINGMMVNADGSEIVNAGDEKISHNFIRKLAFFFTADQVEKTPEPAALPELPADVKQEVKRGCEWISGNTRPIKEDLKKAGFRWSKKNSAWYRRAA